MDELHNQYLEDYRRDGYVVVRGYLDNSYINNCISLMHESLADPEVMRSSMSIAKYHKSKPDRFDLPNDIDVKELGMYIFGPKADSENLRSTLSCRRIWELASMALGVLFDQVEFSFMNFTRKPAKYGASISYHRDFGNKYISTNKSNDMIRLAIPLSDCSENSGGTAFVKFSHLLDDEESIDEKIDQFQAEKTGFMPVTQIGDVLVFNSKTTHGGGRNTTDKNRVNLIMQFVRAKSEHSYRNDKEPYNGSSYLEICGDNTQQSGSSEPLTRPAGL